MALIAASAAPAVAADPSAFWPSPPLCHQGTWTDPKNPTKTERYVKTLQAGDHQYKIYERTYWKPKLDKGRILPSPVDVWWVHSCEGVPATATLAFETYSVFGVKALFGNGNTAVTKAGLGHFGSDWYEVRGAINDRWRAIGAEKSIGYPKTNELSTPVKFGRFNHFERGSIYWSPSSGAHVIRGEIRKKWASLGWENSFLGFPVTDETATPHRYGSFNHFQGGSIYWNSVYGAHFVRGLIRDKWASLGWENSRFGFPISDEHIRPDGMSAFQQFENDCWMEWSWTTNRLTAACPGVGTY